MLASCTYDFVAQLPQMYLWLHMPGSQVNHGYSFVIWMDRAIQFSCFSSRDFGLNCLLCWFMDALPNQYCSFMSVLCQFYATFVPLLCHFYVNFMSVLCQFYGKNLYNFATFFWNMSLPPPLPPPIFGCWDNVKNCNNGWRGHPLMH